MDSKWEHGGNVYAVRRSLEMAKSEILDFSANINPLGLKEELKETLIKGFEDLIHYPDPEYFDLRKAISSYAKVDADLIQIGNGAIELLYMLIEYLQPKRASVIAPGFIEYERSLKRYKSEIDWIYLKEETDFQLNYDSVVNSINSETELLIICNPNNPTGHFLNTLELGKIIDYCKEKDCAILVDEAFIDFLDMKHSISNRMEVYKNLYILRSLTKFFAIPGLRLGYLMTSNQQLHNWCKEYRTPWMVNHLANLAGVAVLGDCEYIEKSIVNLRSLSLELQGALKEISCIKILKPSANYIFFKILESEIDLRALLLKKGILIRSCSNYKGLDSKYYRIAIKNKEENKRLIKELKEILKS